MITCSLKRSSEGCVWLGRWLLYANDCFWWVLWSNLPPPALFFIFLPQGFLCHWIAGGVNEVFSEHNSCVMIYSRLDEPFVVISLSVRRTVAWVWLVCAWLATSGVVVDGQMLYSVGIETDKSAAWCWCWLEESSSYRSQLKIEADGTENTISYHSRRLVPSPWCYSGITSSLYFHIQRKWLCLLWSTPTDWRDGCWADRWPALNSTPSSTDCRHHHSNVSFLFLFTSCCSIVYAILRDLTLLWSIDLTSGFSSIKTSGVKISALTQVINFYSLMALKVLNSVNAGAELGLATLLTAAASVSFFSWQ